MQLRSLRTQIARPVFDLKRYYDVRKMRLKRRLGWLEPAIIIPYNWYGTRDCLALQGRVLEEKELEEVSGSSSPWRNALHMYRRYSSDEIPEARIRARYGDVTTETTSDAEGFFRLEMNVDASAEDGVVWRRVELELLGPKARGQGEVRATGRVIVPPDDAEFGIISDIDDTVIHTGATTFLRQWRTILFNNAFTRRPFPGIDAFYTALQHGPDERGHNPIFYVSSSPWNLYRLFTSILDLHEIPAGPLLLRNYGLDRRKGISLSHKDHKLNQIRPILETYPDLPFVLIGDSGQKDPEIYSSLVDMYPGRISAIYIRDVTPPVRDRVVHDMADKLKAQGVPMVLTEDTGPAARHAVEHGLISAAELPQIERDRQRDEQRSQRPAKAAHQQKRSSQQ